MRMKLDGGEYKDQSVNFQVPVIFDPKIPESIKVVEVEDIRNRIKWYENAPEYFVEEVNLPTGYEKGSITPSSGHLAEKDSFTPSEEDLAYLKNLQIDDEAKEHALVITSINKQVPTSSELRIVKKLDNSDKMSKEYLESLKFTFQLEIDYKDPNREKETEIIELDKNNIEVSDGTYSWVATSDVYKWYNKVAPSYTLTEIYRSDGGVLAGVAIGTLEGGNLENGVYVIETNIVNTTSSKEGAIRLIKQLDLDPTDPKYEVLKNKNYKFIVKVTGTFSYDGGEFKEQTIQLTNDGTPIGCVDVPEGPEAFNENQFVTIDYDIQSYWDSKTIKWYGYTPEYTAEEYLVDEDINHTINPDHGYLTDIDPESQNNSVIITAKNSYDSKVGYLDLTKEFRKLFTRIFKKFSI